LIPQAPDASKNNLALHAAKTAIEFEAYHKSRAEELVSQMGDYATNVANGAVRKRLDKDIKLHVMQISATESQVLFNQY